MQVESIIILLFNGFNFSFLLLLFLQVYFL